MYWCAKKIYTCKNPKTCIIPQIHGRIFLHPPAEHLLFSLKVYQEKCTQKQTMLLLISSA